MNVVLHVVSLFVDGPKIAMIYERATGSPQFRMILNKAREPP